MALVVLGPAALAAWQAVERFSDPVAPDVGPVVLASLGAIAINGTSAWLLVGVRHHGGRSAGPRSCRPATTWR